MRKQFRCALICAWAIFFGLLFCGCGSGSNSVSNVTPNQPYEDYYQDYLANKIDAINTKEKENHINHSFYFITDLHWELNARKSPRLVKEIYEETNVKSIVFCGDYIEKAYEQKLDALKTMRECIQSFQIDDYVAILGNHDRNTVSAQIYEEVSDLEAMQTLNQNRFQDVYFSQDDEENKISCIYLNTNWFSKTSPQYSWLENKLTSYSSEWTILIFMHEYNEYANAGICIKKGEKGVLLDRLLEENKSRIQCSIAGIFSAHTHRDYFDYNSTGVPIVSTTCDAIDAYFPVDNLYKRERGTITEQAFDVVQIDTMQRKVFMTRIGVGVDRTYFY